MSQTGTHAQPLRVAIIGSGPSGFYAAEHLQKRADLVVEIDMFDRLPTPFGLVRGGVAPDHPKIKSVTKVYEKIAAHSGFRFYGNVEFGRDLLHEDMLRHYHAVIYAVGAQTDRRLDVPGEDLLGSHAATEFVAWYNAHPDYRHLTFDLSQERAAVIGNGNVAMDVARILASSYEELAKTDIADYALEALKHSRVREIYVLGRRGPAQAAFTNPEIKELGELSETQVIVRPDEAELDPLSAAALERESDRTVRNNVQTITLYARQPDTGKPRKLYMRFLVSPVELLGTECVEAIRIVKNELYESSDGSLRPRATDQTEVLPMGLVFRSVGYRGVPLPGVPFDERKGVFPNTEGRLLDPAANTPVPGEYVVGWIKRGPSGIIGTNKPDSQATVEKLLEDLRSDALIHPAEAKRAAVERLLAARQIPYVSFADWQLLDEAEQERGKAQSRPRVKYSTVEDMLRVIDERKQAARPSGE